MLRSCLRAAAFTVPAALLLALLATPSSAVQRTVTIYQIQDLTSVNPVAPNSPDTITTTGVITGADIRGSGFGFHIQDPAGGNYSGLLVFTGGANVFADSGYARGDLIRVTGRCIEFSGTASQGGVTEITARSGAAFDPPPTTTKIGTAPLPPFITLANFGQCSETADTTVAEKYEGALVQFGNARNARFPIFASGTSASSLTATWLAVDNAIVGPLDSIQVDGFTLANPQSNAPPVGVVATTVKGIVTVGTRGYRVQLRDNADIVVPAPPALLNAWATSNSTIRLQFDRALELATSQNAANYSRTTLKAVDSAVLVGGAGSQTVDLTTVVNPQVPGEAEGVTAANVKSALGVAMTGPSTQSFRAGITPLSQVQTNYPVNVQHPVASDSSQYTFEQVTVRGIVTGRDGTLYYFQDGTGTNPSNGMAVFAPANGMVEGDDNTFSGVVIEFGSASQITEFSGVDYQLENATGVALPAPVVVANPGQIGALTGVEPFPGERYEAMLVELQNIDVVQDSLPNGQFLVQGSGGAGDTLRVDDTMFRQNVLYSDGVGIHVNRLDGIVNDSFGQYSIQPRRQADIEAEPVGVEPDADLAFALRSIAPTPVSFARGGSAVVRFSIPSAGKVSARVYDVNGRLVAEPASDLTMTAGPQSISFDGRGSNGARLGSGIFFLQLQFGNKVATGKIVVTE